MDMPKYCGLLILAASVVLAQDAGPGDPTAFDCYECTYTAAGGGGGDALCADGARLPQNASYVRPSTPLSRCETCVRQAEYRDGALESLVRMCGVDTMWDDLGDVPLPGCTRVERRGGHTETCYCEAQLCNRGAARNHNGLVQAATTVLMLFVCGWSR